MEAFALDNIGYIFDIKRYAVHDGPGIRTTIFLKGCPLECWWCHNPEGISTKNDLMYFEDKCMHCQRCAQDCPQGAIDFKNSTLHIDRSLCNNCGKCSDTCPTGALKSTARQITVNELIKEIEKDILFFDNSEGGVTFSGGEPLYQYRFLMKALKECKDRYIHTALDTSGYTSSEVFASIADYVDVFLYDFKIADDVEHRKYTGVSNKIIKNNLRMLVDKGRAKDIILRFPVIPGITDTEKNINGLTDFLLSLKEKVKEITILPYHDVGEKYKRLGRNYKMTVHKAPSNEKLKSILERFEKTGNCVKL